MKTSNKIALIVVGIIIFIIASGIIAAKCVLHMRENEAIAMAEAYLERKYDQKMLYQSVGFPGSIHACIT